MKSTLLILALLGAGAALPATAQNAASPGGQGMAHPAASHGMAAPATTPAAQLTQGEVRKVDKESGKLTLRHGPIPNLEMPNMTMVFRVKDPAMLDRVKVGDKVAFAADKIGGQYTVTRLEPAR